MTEFNHSVLKLAFDPDHKDFLETKYGSTGSVQYASDVGFDLYLPSDIIVEPYETKFINLGIKAEYQDIEGKYYGYMLCPRSSISKTKLRLANSIGIIDPHYRGNIIAAVDNISGEIQELKQGERYFQLVFVQFNKPDSVLIVDSVSETDRGAGGFGSTGR